MNFGQNPCPSAAIRKIGVKKTEPQASQNKPYLARKSKIFPIRKHFRHRASYDSFSPNTTVS